MKKSLIFVILVMCGIQSINAQQLVWAKQYGRASGEVTPNKLVTDDSGNIFTAGVFRYETDFDPGPGTYTLTDFSGGHFDAFIQKLNPSGDLIWAKRVGGNYIDFASDMVVDAVGNSYTVGNFESDSVDFDPGPAVFTLTRNFTDNGFILKLDPSGNFVWVKQITKVNGAINSQQVNMDFIRKDAYNNLYIIGTFAGMIDFNPGLAIDSLSGSGIFALKLDSAGNFVWVKKLVGTCNDVTITSSGHLCLTGYFSGQADFDFGLGTNLLNAQTGAAFVLKLDTAGNYIWAKNFGGAQGLGRKIVTDSHDAIYITSISSNYTIPVIASLHKVDLNGNWEWHQDYFNSNFAGYSIAIDTMDVLYVGGRFSDTIDVCPGVGIYNVTPNGANTPILIKMDTLGHLLSVDITQGGVTISSTGEFFRYGYFSGIMDFDPSPGVFQMNTINGCVSIAKYSQCSEYAIAASGVNPTTCPGTDGYIEITGLDSNLSYTILYKKNGVDMPPEVLTNSGSVLLFDSLSFGVYDSITANIGGCQSDSIGPLILTAECDSVWPGDLNYDMIANNNDVLDMLLVYGDTGTIRPNANTTWTAQYGDDWASTQYNTINTKHADCNGDGIVNDDDTLAVSLNYGLTHLKGTHQQQQIIPGYPDLYFDLEGIDIIAGIPVYIPVMLGTSSLPIIDILGMAAQLKVEGVTLLEAPKINATQSWIGEGFSALSFTKDIANNHVDWAFGRKDHSNVSGYGLIAYVRIVFPADAVGKEIVMYFGDVRIIDNKGNALSNLNVLDVRIKVTQMDAAFTIYPNPTTKTAYISSSEAIDKIIVTDVLGKKVYESSPNSNNTTIDLQTTGIYFVTITSKNNKTTRKLIVN